jgi:(1->4)-alpha-D-glucan 1-alpha-D-glucosylmutase
MAVRVPSSTYRLQFHPEFNFGEAERIIPYLAALGIGDVYASPSLTARPGSQHGYDVADPSRVSGELGGEAAFRSLCRSLSGRGMGLLLDIVPNHMAASVVNPWWADLLENGRQSKYADYFDIDWEPSTGKGTLAHKILLPVLGQIYGLAIETGEISIVLGERGFAVKYFELELPVSLRSYRHILGRCLEDAGGESDESRRAIEEELDHHAAVGDGVEDARNAVRTAIRALYSRSESFRTCLDARLKEINGTKGDPSSFVELDAILEEQSYRLAYWRRAADEINYRRFFDIADLVGVRVEQEEVFEERHRLILRLVSEGLVTGLRIDHVDGLYDPEAYLRRLQNAAAPGWAGDPKALDFYVVVEKILAADEKLPAEFATHGTSGYDYLNVLNNVFVDPSGLRKLDGFYRSFTGIGAEFETIAYERKRQVLDELFWGDVRRLGDQLIAIARDDRYARDVHSRQISRALVELTAWLSVYRTYTRSEAVRTEDREFVERAYQRARREPFLSRRAIEFVRRVLLLEPPSYAEGQKREWLEFVMRWQQFTGRVMAKGVEDTSFYVYNRLISMNEVGSEPHVDIRRATGEFHDYNRETAERWPHQLNATSTHDTKRSEDVRARINVLSEIPDRWARAVDRWRRTNARKKAVVHGSPVPDANEELLLYQTLIGIWPLERSAEKHLPSRIENFVTKAVREAKVHSRWTRPDDEYERAYIAFAKLLVTRSRLGWFRDFERLQEYVAHFGALNALSQVVLKTMSPGVPDFYQGTEVWNFSLVDPDNRRDVDYARRLKMMQEIDRMRYPAKLLSTWRDGRIKLYVTRKLLRLRQEHESLFREGSYAPVRAIGLRARNLVAFARADGEKTLLVVVPRFATELVSPPRFPMGRRVWRDTRLSLPAGRFVNVFTGLAPNSSAIGDIFETLPFAVLLSQP